jgi:hypothetical protein
MISIFDYKRAEEVVMSRGSLARFLANIAYVRMKLLKLTPYETTEIHSILYSIWFQESGFNGLLDSEQAFFSYKV